MSNPTKSQANRAPWNSRRRIGPKPPLKLREIWAIRTRLQLAKRTRDLALFNLAIDSKLRGCDLLRVRVRDIDHGGSIVAWAIVLQQYRNILNMDFPGDVFSLLCANVMSLRRG